jgi:hypothetical protein
MQRHFILGAMLLFASSTQAASLLNGLGGLADFGENSLAHNDDQSSKAIDITSVFSGGVNFFGTTYSSLYLNNNGNITFASSLYNYTPSTITGNTSNPMLAVFFADVDTREHITSSNFGNESQKGNNLVYWDLDPSAGRFTATWNQVGYYSMHTDLLNSFQVILTNNGSGNFDVEYRYQDINWTTGDASGGRRGLGGTVARAGWTSGNGLDFFELAASGNQTAMLNLENTSNVDQAGIYRFEVNNGQLAKQAPMLIQNAVEINTVPEPTSIALLGIGLLGFAFSWRKTIGL